MLSLTSEDSFLNLLKVTRESKIDLFKLIYKFKLFISQKCLLSGNTVINSVSNN